MDKVIPSWLNRLYPNLVARWVAGDGLRYERQNDRSREPENEVARNGPGLPIGGRTGGAGQVYPRTSGQVDK